MEQVVQNLSSLKGVIHACLYGDGEMIASTFEDEQSDKMTEMAEMVEQVFSALRAIEKQHDEIYFSLDNRYIAVYYLNESHIALLLTEKKINFPLVHMGVKSAAGKIRQIQEKERQQQIQQTQQVNGVAGDPAPIAHIPTSENVKTQLIRISTVLMGYLGPAAMLVVDDHAEEWKRKYPQTPENLQFLVAMLESELTSDSDKQQFRERAMNVVNE